MMILMVSKAVGGQTVAENNMDCVDMMQQSHLMGIPEKDMYIGNKIQKNRPIYGIKNYTPEVGEYYGVIWSSDDGDKHSGTYTHYGRLIITNIDNNHPNHS